MLQLINQILQHTQFRLRDEKGASAIEYTVLVALIIVVIVGAIATLGGTLNGVWTTINTKLL